MSEAEKYDYKIEVSPAPAPQSIECPGCGHEFNELIQEGRVVVSGGTCPSCDAWIRYDRGRSEGEKEDDTEQTTLVTDDGRVERPDPPEDPFACSICGQPLGTVERLENGGNCDACLREYGFKERETNRSVDTASDRRDFEVTTE